MPPPNNTWEVIVKFDVRGDGIGQSFGPFHEHEAAENCVIALATRANVCAAEIKLIEV